MMYIKKVSRIFLFTIVAIGFSGCAWNPLKDSQNLQEPQPIVEDIQSITQQFIQQKSQEGALQEDEWQRVISEGEKAMLFDDARGPEMMRGKTYTEKLDLIGTFIEKMLDDTGRSRVSQSNGAMTDTEIPPIDLITGAKKYYYGADGMDRYMEYLSQRFTIGVYPTMEELRGQWEGDLVIKDVMIFHELGGAPVHYDEKQLMSIRGQRSPISFVLTPTDAENGVMVPAAGAGGSSIPFAYEFLGDFTDRITKATFLYRDIAEKGKMGVVFKQDRISGFMQVYATKEGDVPMIKGAVTSELYNGYLKISGEITARKQ